VKTVDQDFIPYFNPALMRYQKHSPTMVMPLMLARAYVLNQPYTGLFSLEKALKVGTIFPNMYEAFPERM
jgi:hypothetical protein